MSTEEDEEHIIIADRVTQGPALAPNSKSQPCDKCGELVWLSPSSQALLADETKRAVARCIPCARDFMLEADQIRLMPGQVEELTRLAGPEVAQQAQDLVEQLDRIQQSKKN